MEGAMAKRFVSCRERRLDTSTSDSDEADDSSYWRCLREGGRGCRSGESTLAVLYSESGASREQDVEWRGASQTRSAKTRVYLVWEAQSLWASESRDFGALES